MPPPWSIRPTRARNVRPPLAGSTTEHADPPAVRAPIALDDLDGRRLARAVRPEQRDELARRDLERDPVEHGPLAVALDQPVDDDQRVAARS